MVTEIEGEKVVIWTLEQDKSNSLILEKGFQYFKDNELLRKDTADLIKLNEIKNNQILNLKSQLEESEGRSQNKGRQVDEALELADVYKDKFKKQKRLKIITMLIGGGLLVLVGTR